jgi:hypothetical protein
MSQENPTKEKSKETKKWIVFGALMVLLVGVVYFQFIYRGNEKPSNPPQGVAANRTTASPTPRPSPRTGGTPERIVTDPLDLALLTNRRVSGDGTGRNIFIYPTPTPTPPPKPPSPTPTPVPPPITLSSVNPIGVIARTGDFTLTVFGAKIPQDAKVLLNGREFPTTFVNAGQVTAKITSDAIRSKGDMGVQVRSASDTKLFSNQLSLNVADPPAFPYRYIGLIVSKKGTIAVLMSQADDEVINVSKDGKIFGSQWRVISINPQQIVVEDTKIKVTHTIGFTGEKG